MLTRHPQLRYPPAQVREVLERLMQTWTVLTLAPADYLDAVTRCRDLGTWAFRVGRSTTP